MLKYIYTVFIGILLATFVGLGIDAFYPSPKLPEYPRDDLYPAKLAPDGTYQSTEEQRQRQVEYEKKQRNFEEENKKYNRDVSIISLVFAVAMLIISLVLIKNLLLLSDGVLLGGVITLLYSIIRGFSAGDSKFRFIVVTIGLIAALIIGYLKFVRPQQAAK